MKARYQYDSQLQPMEPLEKDLRWISPLCLEILNRRGYRTNQDIRGLLSPSLKNALSPLGCRDEKAALDILERAVREQQQIVVYRDYDVDGITAGATAVEGLRSLGARVEHYANQRCEDGYNICPRGIDTIVQRWPETKVILTVDNGIAGHDAALRARELGLTMVITDHHTPGETLPDAAAVVDLKREDETVSFRDLCGCGLIFRLLLDLYRRMGQDPHPILRTLDMVALATVADIVPLLGDNRALVQAGIRIMQSGHRPFFQALNQRMGPERITAHSTLAFHVAPLLNSLSRLNQDTAVAVEALLTHDPRLAEQRMEEFQKLNDSRKARTREQIQLATEMADTAADSTILILRNSSFDEGIAGIVAGALKDGYARPALVLAEAADGQLKGSARSIDAFDIRAALDTCDSLLTAHGGHPKAAGFSLLPENYEVFTEEMTDLADRTLMGRDLRPCVSLDAVLTERQVTVPLVKSLQALEPFGEAFPEPVFGLNARPDSIRFMGEDQRHVRLTCSRTGLTIIGWRQADLFRHADPEHLPGKHVGHLNLNSWNGRVFPQFIRDP